MVNSAFDISPKEESSSPQSSDSNSFVSQIELPVSNLLLRSDKNNIVDSVADSTDDLLDDDDEPDNAVCSPPKSFANDCDDDDDVKTYGFPPSGGYGFPVSLYGKGDPPPSSGSVAGTPRSPSARTMPLTAGRVREFTDNDDNNESDIRPPKCYMAKEPSYV